MIDTHCHILPGLDDGASNLAVSLEMARVAAADGIRTIVATPHVTADGVGPEPALVRERVAELQAAITAAGIELAVLPGTEYAASDVLATRAKAGEIMTVADQGRHILVEMFLNARTDFIEQLVFALQLGGLTPIIAHPERSLMAREKPQVLRELALRGCLMQVNCASVLGQEGRETHAVAQALLREGLVDLIATDAHDPRHRPPLLSPCAARLRKLGAGDVYERATRTTPAKLIAGT
jgi:protein-tyrosine phosphatase